MQDRGFGSLIPRSQAKTSVDEGWIWTLGRYFTSEAGWKSVSIVVFRGTDLPGNFFLRVASLRVCPSGIALPGTAALGTAALGIAASGTAALGSAASGTAAWSTLCQGPLRRGPLRRGPLLWWPFRRGRIFWWPLLWGLSLWWLLCRWRLLWWSRPATRMETAHWASLRVTRLGPPTTVAIAARLPHMLALFVSQGRALSTYSGVKLLF